MAQSVPAMCGATENNAARGSKMQFPKCLTSLFIRSIPSKWEVRSSVRFTATLITVPLFFLALMCPLCKAGTESVNSPAAAPNQENFWLGTGVLMVVALAFAWLKLLKDFYQYRGLLTA